jgi:hypothetical protein
MPCCAFAACIVGQLFLAFGAVKRALFGGAPYGIAARNAGVGWRLDSPAAPSLGSAPRWAWLRSRRAVGGFAFPAALELLVILGAVYGVMEHLGHGVGRAEPPLVSSPRSIRRCERMDERGQSVGLGASADDDDRPRTSPRCGRYGGGRSAPLSAHR